MPKSSPKAPARPSFTWHPIDTAPKDGTTVMVAWRISLNLADHGPVLASWCTFHPNAKGKMCWRGVDGMKIGDPTHWSPMPLLPGEAEGEKMPCDLAVAGTACVLSRNHRGKHKSANGMVWDYEAWAWVPRKS